MTKEFAEEQLEERSEWRNSSGGGREGRCRIQGLLEIKDTHRPLEGPMLLGIDLP